MNSFTKLKKKVSIINDRIYLIFWVTNAPCSNDNFMPSFIGNYRNVNIKKMYIYKNSEITLYQNKNDKYSIINSNRGDTL